MINPEKELFRWGPIDGRVIYMDAFAQAFVEHAKAYPKGWPDAIGYYKDDKGLWVIDYSELRNNGEVLFQKFAMDDKILKSEYYQWTKAAKEILKFEKQVNTKKFKKLSDAELKKAFKDWDKAHISFWVKGFLPELGNWGGEQWLKRELTEMKICTGGIAGTDSTAKNITHEQFVEIFEAISAPDDLSFFQTEELDLMKIKLMKDKKAQENALQDHQRKYYWLRNSYGFTKVLDIGFFNEELGRISEADAKKKLQSINSYKKTITEKKNLIVQKYTIPQSIVNIAKKLAYCVWWQDYRKSFIFRANHIISCFLAEIGKRKKIPFKEMC